MKKTKIAMFLATALSSTAVYADTVRIGEYTGVNGGRATLNIEITDQNEGRGGGDDRTLTTVGTIDPTTDAWSNFKLNVGVKLTPEQIAASGVNKQTYTSELQMGEQLLFQATDYITWKNEIPAAMNASTRDDYAVMKADLTDKAKNSIGAVADANIQNGVADKAQTSGPIANRDTNNKLTFAGTTDMKVTTDGTGTVVYGLSDANKNKLNTQSNFTVNGSTTPSKTWTLKTDNTPNTLDFSGGKNLEVAYDNGSIKYGLKDDIAFTDDGSITVGTTPANKIVIDKTGIDVNGTKINNNGIISGVAEGVADTDAVNVAQLKRIKPNTSVTKDANIVIENGTNADGGIEYGFKLNKTVTIGDNTSPLGEGIKIDGTTNKISNLAEGVDDNDAVNVKQLKTAKTTAKANDDNIVVEKGTNADGGNEYGFSLNETVSVGKGNSPLGVAIKIDGTTNKISNLAEGTDDNDAVNVAQLKRIKPNTSTTEDNNIKINETINPEGGKNYGFSLNDVVKIGKTSPIEIDGKVGKIKAGDITINDGGKITGVADGEISDTSRDAINGSQLYKVQNIINKNTQKRVDGGVAQANAMAGLIQVTEKGKKIVSASLGSYGKGGALAVGVSGMTDNGRIIYKLGVGVGNTVNDKGKNRARVGGNAAIGYQW